MEAQHCCEVVVIVTIYHFPQRTHNTTLVNQSVIAYVDRSQKGCITALLTDSSSPSLLGHFSVSRSTTQLWCDSDGRYRLPRFSDRMQTSGETERHCLRRHFSLSGCTTQLQTDSDSQCQLGQLLVFRSRWHLRARKGAHALRLVFQHSL